MLVKDTKGKVTIPYKEQEEEKKKKVAPVKSSTAPAVTVPDKAEPKTQPSIPFKAETTPITIEPPSVEVQTTQPRDYSGKISNLQQDLINREAQLKRENLRNQFADTTRAVNQQREGLGRTFAEQRGNIRTEGQMATRGSQVALAGGGLSDSGAMAQTQAIQSAATRGSLAQSRFQENEIRQQLDNKIYEARQLMQRGISDANTQAEIQVLENELKNIQAMQEQEIERAKLADERAFKLQQDQVRFLNDAQMAQIENQLEQQNMALEAQYEDALAQRDNVRQQQILEQKAENDARLAAINNAARMEQIRVSGAQDIALQKQRAADDMARLESEQQIAQQEAEMQSERDLAETQRKTYNSVVNDIQTVLGDPMLGEEQKRNAIGRAILAQANNLSPQQGIDLMNAYGFTQNELKALTGR